MRALVLECRHPEAFYHALRCVLIDGSSLEVSDKAENIEAFGYPGSRVGQASYPKTQCAVLGECSAQAILAGNVEACRTIEWEVCKALLETSTPGRLCMADRGFTAANTSSPRL
ncbi:MAG: hypothetical protein ABI268_13315 [Rhodanobacter sp.]